MILSLAMCNFQSMGIATVFASMTTLLLGYEPADLTVHPPPPRMIESGLIFFVWVSSATKNFSSKKSGFCRRY